MTILERARQVGVDLAELGTLRADALAAEGFATRARELGGPARELRDLLPVLRLLRAHGIVVDVGSVGDLQGQARAFAELYRQDRQVAVRPDPERKRRFWTPLKTFAAGLETALRTAWSGHVSHLFVPPAAALLDTLQPVPGFSDAVRDVRHLITQAEALRAALPRSPDDLQAVQDLADRLREAWAAVGADGLDAEVSVFLRAAAAGVARLTQLTPTVRTWIDDHPSLGEALRISLRREA